MSHHFASQLPAGSSNFIEKIAIVGVSGQIGRYLTAELLKTGQHKVTAVSRVDSKAEIPSGVATVRVNYDDYASLVEGLKGQDLLIITMGVMAPRDTQRKLISAAKDAGVQWVMPNEWGYASNKADDNFGTESG